MLSIGIGSLATSYQKKYTVGENGTVELTGNIDYNQFCEYYILELDYEDTKTIYLIEKRYSRFNDGNIYDVKTNNFLCELKKDKLSGINCTDFKISPVKDILIQNEMLKDSYNSDDIDKIIELYKEKNNIDNNKKLEDSLKK